MNRKNFRLSISNGYDTYDCRYMLGVPNTLSERGRTLWTPYLNLYDERGIVGTLRIQELRRLKRWMERVGV